MTHRTYDYNDFEDMASWIEVKFNYRKDVNASEDTAEWIESFATGPFLITLNTIVFDKEKDAVIFSLGYKDDKI